MAFSHDRGAFNVIGTLNNWFETNITAQGNPTWMPSARVKFDWHTDDPLISGYSGHAFSVVHLGHDAAEGYQGRVTNPGKIGQTREGLMDVSCWVSRRVAGNAHEYRLRQMGDMVTQLFASAREVELTNLYTGASGPSGIGALIRVMPAEQVVANDDPNADIRRQRFLVQYRWLEETNG